jgi:hypothetical protein
MPKRELSCFLCRELLYEYVSGTIDSRRAEAVALHLRDCAECKHEQENLKGASAYVKKLASVEIRPEYLADISHPTPIRRLMARRLGWSSWPDPLKWTVESLVFAGVVAFLVGYLGDEYFKIPEKKKVAAVEHPAETVNVSQLPDQTPAEFGEEEFTDHDSEGDISPVASSPVPLEKRVATPEPDVKVVQVEQEMADSPPLKTSPASAPAAEPPVHNQGFLYRANFKVQSVEGATSELVTEIESLGGKKAGEVPLGWKRPNGSYFHFSMPESNYSRLNEFLKKYGAPAIVKEKNPRVMPTGSIRMILEIEGDAPSSEASTPMEPSEEPVAAPVEPTAETSMPADASPAEPAAPAVTPAPPPSEQQAHGQE